MSPVATLAAPWAQVSGKFRGSPTLDPGGGEVVAMPQPNGQTNLRANVQSNQPNSPAQQQARARMQSVSEAYQSLTIEQVDGWKALADQLEYSNRFGVDYNPNWNNVFSQVNNYRLQAGEAIVSDAPPFNPPPLFEFIDDTPLSSEASGSDWLLSCSYQFIVAGDAIAGVPCRLRVSRPTTSPVFQIPENELRMTNSDASLNWSDTIAAQGQDIGVTSNRLNIAPGDRVAVEVFCLTEDFVPAQQLLIRNSVVQAI